MAKKVFSNKFPKWPFWTAWVLYLFVTMYLGVSGFALSVGTVIALIFAFAFATTLMLLPYWYEDRVRLKEAELIEAKCSNNVLEAMKKSELLLQRVAELASDASKSILVARQIPDRIQEKLAVLQQLVEKQELKNFDKLMPLINAIQKIDYERFDDFSSLLDQLIEKLGHARAQSVSDLDKNSEVLMSELLAKLESLILEQKESLKSNQIEILEGIQLKLDSFAEPVKIVDDSSLNIEKADKKKVAKKTAPKKKAKSMEEDFELLMDFDTKDEELDFDSHSAPVEEEALEEVAIVEPSKLEPSSKLEPEEGLLDEASLYEEFDSVSIEEPESALPEASELLQGEIPLVETKRSPEDASLSIISKIPLNEILYIRGDEPYLSWDQGVEMTMVAMDTWKFTISNIKEAVDCSIFLADVIESKEGDITLNPGDNIELKLHFDDDPF